MELFRIGDTQQSQVQNGEQRSVVCSWWSEVVFESSIFCIVLSFGTSTQGIAVSTNT